VCLSPASSLKKACNNITDGGGEYKIHLTGRRTVTSYDAIKSKVVEEAELEIAASNAGTLKDFCDTLFSWLKH
jgi:hypothetical protein